MKDTNNIKEPPVSDCFSLEQLLLYMDKNMSEEKLRHVEKHLEVCDMCADALTGYKKVNDRVAIKHSVAEITRHIQQQTGLEENEEVIKADYRVGIAIGVCVILAFGVFFGMRHFYFSDTGTSKEDSILSAQQLMQDSMALIVKEENLLAKKDSVISIDSASNAMDSTGLSVEKGIIVSQITEKTDTAKINVVVPVPTPISGPRKSPKFPGGDMGAIQFINSNKKYPEQAKESNIHGMVKLAFTLDENGKVVKTRIVKGIGGGCDEEASRLFMSMPNWVPANDGTKNIGGEYVWDIQF